MKMKKKKHTNNQKNKDTHLCEVLCLKHTQRAIGRDD